MHRRILLMPLFVGTVTAGARQAPQQPSFADRVDVQRVIVDARVVNDDGSPVLGLIAADFRVKIDGKPARIDSAAWFGGDGLPRNSRRRLNVRNHFHCCLLSIQRRDVAHTRLRKACSSSPRH